MLLIFSYYSASSGYLSKVIRCFPLCLSSGDGRCRRGWSLDWWQRAEIPYKHGEHRRGTISWKTNKVLEKWGYSEVRGNAEEMLSVSASVKARQDLRLRIVFAIVSATSLIGAWITSGGGFNRQYLIAFIGLTLISSFYSFFTYVDMGSRDAASAILNHRASTA